MSSNSRVLLLIPSMASVGGAERMVHSLSSLLKSSGREVHQASYDRPGVQRHFESDTPLHCLGPLPRLPLPFRPITYVLAAWRLRRLKRHLRIDVTISNLWGADLISVLSQGCDRKIALCHINVVGNSHNRLMLRFLPLVARIYRSFDRVLAVNATLAQEIGSLYDLRRERVSYIDNFVDRPDTISKLPLDDVRRFVWCGRFSPEKNVEGLLYAWCEFARARERVQLVLVGDGPLRADMLALAEHLGLRPGKDMDNKDSRVAFIGKVGDPAAYMLGATALLLSSHAEGLPMVLLEALSLGVPVLAADCPAGGVRAAMVGGGNFDPDREDVECVPPGVLLPVPRPGKAVSLAAWATALHKGCDDGATWDSWSQGALQRAALFNSSTTLAKWEEALAYRGDRS